MLNIKIVRIPLLLAVVSGIFPAFAFALEAPKDLRGTEIKQNTVHWEWAAASGASHYEVTVNGKVLGVTDKTSVKSYNLFAGEHFMFVRSISPDGSKSAPTHTAKITTHVEFKHGNHGRSELLARSEQSDSSSGFSAPRNARAEDKGAGVVRWRWDRVEGAATYDIFVNGNYQGTTKGIDWTTSDLWNGTHSMSVKAISADRKISDHSNTVLFTVKHGQSSNNPDSSLSASFGAPTNPQGGIIQGGDVWWKWDSVTGAEKYEVTVDGNYAGETEGTEWISKDLWVGEHSMTVKAIGATRQKSSQSATVKINVTSRGTGGGNPAPPPPQADSTTGEESQSGGDPAAATIQSLIDPASYSYPEVQDMAGWELTFSDEFNGTALNPYRWNSQLRWDGEWNGERFEYRIINGESQFYVNPLSSDKEHIEKILPLHNPFKFNGNRLAIRAIRNPIKDRGYERSHGNLEEVSRQQPFLSGALSTSGKFSQKYGRFEARIKIPNSVGTFPAFWLLHERRAKDRNTQRTEIDIMENLGHAPHYIYNSFHFFKNVSEHYFGDWTQLSPKPSGQINAKNLSFVEGEDFSKNFHVYAVEWSPSKAIWFIDGQKVSELNHHELNHEELHVMLNLAVGGYWTNYPTGGGGLGRPRDQRFPTDNDINNFGAPELEIDFVRVYKPL